MHPFLIEALYGVLSCGASLFDRSLYGVVSCGASLPFFVRRRACVSVLSCGSSQAPLPFFSQKRLSLGKPRAEQEAAAAAASGSDGTFARSSSGSPLSAADAAFLAGTHEELLTVAVDRLTDIVTEADGTTDRDALVRCCCLFIYCLLFYCFTAHPKSA